jgi:PKHD-type hydroxylase
MPPTRDFRASDEMTDAASRPAAPGSGSGPDRVLIPFVEIEKCFSPEECAKIIAFGGGLPLAKGEATGRDMAPTARNSTIALFGPGADSQWIFDRVFGVVGRLNRQYWQFELSGVERIQFSRYVGGEYYDWHMDLAAKGVLSRRKVTVTVQLSGPDDYEGGELEVNLGSTTRAAAKDVGLLVAFPSYGLHRIRPVTRGVRHSLSAWFGGQTGFR